MSNMHEEWLKQLYSGLQFIIASDFPKRCSTCGKVYETSEEFLEETRSVMGGSGLKESFDDDERTCVELFRNCACGSTLMEVCRDRRDTSELGLKRRQTFGAILDMLKARGVEEAVARGELLKVMRGSESEVLKSLGIRFDPPKP